MTAVHQLPVYCSTDEARLVVYTVLAKVRYHSGDTHMVEYNVIPEDEWNQIQAAQQKPDEWGPLLADLSQGKIVSIPYTDGKDRRRIRMSITRRAMSWGFKTEARYTETQLAVRRSDTPPTPVQAQPQRV